MRSDRVNLTNGTAAGAILAVGMRKKEGVWKMTTREAINEAASYFINNCENPSSTDIRLVLNELVNNHRYSQSWAVNQVKAKLRKRWKVDEDEYNAEMNLRSFISVKKWW